jgi:hypothetical protein
LLVQGIDQEVVGPQDERQPAIPRIMSRLNMARSLPHLRNSD